MKSILFLTLLISALCFSSCNRRASLAGLDLSGTGAGGGGRAEGYGIGSIGSLGAGHSTETSRNEPLERHFLLITSSEDQEEIMLGMMEVLELCESEETTVKIFLSAGEEEQEVITTNIREYLNLLHAERAYTDKIKATSYNDEGKLTLLFLIRE